MGRGAICGGARGALTEQLQQCVHQPQLCGTFGSLVLATESQGRAGGGGAGQELDNYGVQD